LERKKKCPQDKTLVSRRFTSKYVVLECSVGPT
jgi:hypothetical protein